MGLFFNTKPEPPDPLPKPPIARLVKQIDLSKRYDIYYGVAYEERLYENVRFLGYRSFERPEDYYYPRGFLEIEMANGSTILLPEYGIQLICEHGMQPVFRVVRRWVPREA